jgi:hypothetical protein
MFKIIYVDGVASFRVYGDGTIHDLRSSNGSWAQACKKYMMDTLEAAAKEGKNIEMK